MYSHIISVTNWCFFNHTFNHSLLSTTKGFNQSCSGNVAIIWGNQYFLIQLFISMLISNWNLTSHWKSWRWIMWMSCTLIVYSYLFFKKIYRTEHSLSFHWLELTWNCSGDVCQQFIQWYYYLGRFNYAESMVGTEWHRGHYVLNAVCSFARSEQVNIL